MLNIITICGRLTKDPDLRMTQSQKPVASFTVACERDYAAAGEQRKADFIDVVVFNNTASFVHDYMAKGSMAIITGRLQARDWTDRDNNKRRAWEVIADRVYFGESKKRENAKAEAPRVGFQELDDTDGEIPF